MVPVRPPRPGRTGAVAADTGKRRRPLWLWLLLLLLALLLLAWLLYAIFHKTHSKKAAASPAVSTAPSVAGSAAAGPSAVPSTSPSAVVSTATTPAPGGATAGYGAALVGGGAIAALPATGTEAAAASSANGQSTGAGSNGTHAAATGPQGTVLFPSGSAALDGASLQVIKTAAARIKALHPASVTVTGYTDVVGGQPKNDNLSQQRADAVAAALRQDLGASPPVTATAKSDADPIAPNTTAAGRQQNRRASITSS